MSTNRPPEIGKSAPDFTLPSTAGEDITLSSFRGKSNVLLAFFPLAFTGTCTREMCEFTGDFDRFESVNAKVFGVSVDSIPTLNEFRAKDDISVDLLSDFKREVAGLYGTLLEEQFFSNRSYFMIDKAGILRWSFTEPELGSKRDNSELLAELEKLT